MQLHLEASNIVAIAKSDQPAILKQRQLAELEQAANDHGLSITAGSNGIARAELNANIKADELRVYLDRAGIQAVNIEAADIIPLCGPGHDGPDNPVSAEMTRWLQNPPAGEEAKAAKFRQRLQGLRPNEIESTLDDLARVAVWNRPRTMQMQKATYEGFPETNSEMEDRIELEKIEALKAEIAPEAMHCRHHFLASKCPYGCGGQQ